MFLFLLILRNQQLPKIREPSESEQQNLKEKEEAFH